MRTNKLFVCFVVISEVLLQLLFKRRGFGIPNGGVSFGLASGVPMIFLIFGLILFLLVSYQKRSELWWSLMFSGGLANLISRFLFGGGVWDYIRVVNLWFNGADLMISTGILIMLYENRNLVARQ